jgi:hypothetical protein
MKVVQTSLSASLIHCIQGHVGQCIDISSRYPVTLTDWKRSTDDFLIIHILKQDKVGDFEPA